MKIRKGYLYIAIGLLLIAVLAWIGNSLWYSTILPQVGQADSLSLALIGLTAFGGGIITFFTPCGLAILPAFLSYNLAAVSGVGSEGNETKNNPAGAQLKPYLMKLGIFAALGMLTFFSLLGGAFAVVGSAVNRFLTPLKYVIAVLLVIFGLLLYKNVTFVSGFYEHLRKAVHKEAMQRSGYKAFYLFGFAYGLDTIGCLFPLVFALMLIPLLSGNPMVSLLGFVAYSAGVAFMVTLFAYGIARGKERITGAVERTELIRKLAGLGLMVGGIVLIVYLLFSGMAISAV